MKDFFRIIGLVAACTLAGACGHAGEEFDTTHANDVQKGQAKAEILAWFGEPQQKVSPLPGNPHGCVERWTWVYSKAVVGQQPKTQSLVVDFDGGGNVCDHAFMTQG